MLSVRVDEPSAGTGSTGMLSVRVDEPEAQKAALGDVEYAPCT